MFLRKSTYQNMQVEQKEKYSPNTFFLLSSTKNEIFRKNPKNSNSFVWQKPYSRSNEHLWMATFHSCPKVLKSSCEIVFYCICLLKSCNFYMKQKQSPGVVLRKRCSGNLVKFNRLTQEVVVQRLSAKKCS